MHKNRTLDYPEWQPLANDGPNTFAGNSYNPYIGTEKEDIWNNSIHIGLGRILDKSYSLQKQLI